MAGHPGNHYRPTAGPLKGQSVYLSKAQQAGRSRDYTLLLLNKGDARVMGDVNTQRPAGAAKAAPQPAPTVAPKSAAKANADQTVAYGTDPTQTYTLRYRLVDMAEIQASNTATGGINPAYDPALQPRDRSRMASQAQIDMVAKNLNPHAMLLDFHQIDKGTPIIDANGNVLSGNGRTLALQRAAAAHPAVYDAYKQKIQELADDLGIDTTAMKTMKQPVVVRELLGSHDTAAFAREANSSGTLRMSPLEQAQVDAGLVTDAHVLRLSVKDGQNIDQALRDSSNATFVQDFMKIVPDNERANLLTRSGDLNQMGLYRVKAALYTRAFPGKAGSRMAESMLESLDPDLKTIQNGISASLPSLVRTRAQVTSGSRSKDLDLSEDFAVAIDTLARIKDNPAFTANTPSNQVVQKYLSQSQMFGNGLTKTQERLLVHLDSISRKPTEVKAFFARYATLVENQPPPGQVDLFGNPAGLDQDGLLTALGI